MHDAIRYTPSDAAQFVAHKEHSFPSRDKSIATLRAYGYVAPGDEPPLGQVDFTHHNTEAEYRSDVQWKLDRFLESWVGHGKKTSEHYHPEDLEPLEETYINMGGEFFLRLNGVLEHITEPSFKVPPGVIHRVEGHEGGVHLLIVMKNAFLYPLDRQHIPARKHPRYAEIYANPSSQ